MTRLNRIGVVIFLTVFVQCIFVSAQSDTAVSINVSKGQFVVLKIPSKIIGFERVSWWDGEVSYGTIIEPSQTGGLLVGGLTQWKTVGWSLMRQLTLEKVSHDKNFTTLELKDPLFNVKLRFSNSIRDLNAAFNEVAFIGLLSAFTASDYYKNELLGKVLPNVFTGPLQSIPVERKLKLLELLKFVDTSINNERYKGQTYLSVNVGGDTFVYNTIRLDQGARIGDSLNQRVLSYFKRIGRSIKFHSQVDGIKITILIPYKNFLTETYLAPSYDRVEIYALMDVVQQFSEDDLTNQEFVDESILLVNGNRSQIPIVKSL